MSPSPTPRHSYVVLRLGAKLVGHVEKHKLGRVYGDVDTVFGEHDVRRPDLLYFASARLHLIGEKAMEGPPDLCIEVLSPSSGTIDRRDKFEQYARGAVSFYWILDPKRCTIEAFQLVRGKYKEVGSGADNDLVRLAPFPKLRIELADLWQPD